MLRSAVPIALLTIFFVPGALAAGETSQGHTIVEADTARSTALGSPSDSHQTYGVSLLRLGESGQGFGARLSLVPALSSTEAWELSADAVARFANEGPWYVKGLGGVAVAPPNLLGTPWLRAGAEVGLTAIRGGIGLEAGISAIVSFPPARPLEGQVVVSLGVGVLFGFGAPSAEPVASCQEAPSTERHAQGRQALRRDTGNISMADHPAATLPASPMTKLVLAAAPLGGSFNTCGGSKGTPQCLQAMSPEEGAASTSATAPPAPGATTTTAAPAQARGAASSTAAGSVPSAVPETLPGWKAAAAVVASMGAALGLESDEKRTREAEQARLMEQSARTLEELKREQAQRHSTAEGPDVARKVRPEGPGRKFQLPASEASLPIQEPGETVVPRVDSPIRAPLSAPGSSEDQAIAEPDHERQSPREHHNPDGQHGKPDHKATVARLKEQAKQEFPNARLEFGRSIYSRTGVNRRPDVWVRDPVTDKVLKVYEAARFNPDGSLPKREQLKKIEYDRAGIPSHFEPAKP